MSGHPEEKRRRIARRLKERHPELYALVNDPVVREIVETFGAQVYVEVTPS